MKESITKISRGLVGMFLVVVLAACQSVGPTECERHLGLDFYEVVEESPCEDCEEVTFISDLAPLDRLTVRENSLLGLDACHVSHVFVYADAVMLVLDQEAASRVSSSEGLNRLEASRLVLVRLSGRGNAISLIRAGDVRRSLPLLDLDRESEIDSFLKWIEPARATIVRHPVAIRPAAGSASDDPGPGSTERLERTARNQPLLEELGRLAREGKTGTPEFEAILKRLETSP